MQLGSGRLWVRQTLLSLACVMAATLLTFPLQHFTVHSLTLFYMAAVIVAARYGGVIPGIAVSILSLLAFDWFFDITPYDLDFSIAAFIRALVFFGVSALVASLENQRRNAISGLESANHDLQKALDEVRTLRGILPICMYCKQIKNDAGAWTQIEDYVRQHSEAEFTHGMCPDCFQKHHPEVYQKSVGGNL